MNRLGMAIPYNEMNLFDTTLAKRAIETTRQNIVTVNDAIKCMLYFKVLWIISTTMKILNWYILLVMTRY